MACWENSMLGFQKGTMAGLWNQTRRIPIMNEETL